MTYLSNIEANRAEYRAALTKRANDAKKMTMQTFTFDGLEHRGQAAAIQKYFMELMTDRAFLEAVYQGARRVFSGQRFTEDGKRAA